MYKSIFLMVLSLMLMHYSSSGIAAQDEAKQDKPKETYLVIYRPGPKWLEGKSLGEQPLLEHGKYMLSLYIKGSMTQAGPFTDDTGGAALLVVNDESEAKVLVAEDPAVKAGIFAYEMHPWKWQPWDEFAKKVKASAQPSVPAKQ